VRIDQLAETANDFRLDGLYAGHDRREARRDVGQRTVEGELVGEPGSVRFGAEPGLGGGDGGHGERAIPVILALASDSIAARQGKSLRGRRPGRSAAAVHHVRREGCTGVEAPMLKRGVVGFGRCAYSAEIVRPGVVRRP
jgi:hypothetical protein